MLFSSAGLRDCSECTKATEEDSEVGEVAAVEGVGIFSDIGGDTGRTGECAIAATEANTDGCV